MATNPIVNIISKLHQINQNHQDSFFNLLAFGLQASSLMIKSGTSVNNPTAMGLSNLGQSINSSRFILRFLSGVSSLHVILSNRSVLVELLQSIFGKKSMKEKSLDDQGIASSPITTPTNKIDRIVQSLRLLQAIFITMGNVAEIPAYISTVAPMLYNYHGDSFGRLSCFFWFLNTMVEIVIVTLMRYSTKEITSAQYQISLVPLICDVFLSANWSLQAKNQFLSEAGLTSLGLLSACVNFRSIWNNISPKE